METLDKDTTFKAAWKTLEQSHKNALVTGRAGTGKSTLLRHFCEHSSKEWVVLAPTGIAAIHVKGATIHSFFRFPLRPLIKVKDEIPKFRRDSDTFQMIEQLDTLIIDEISMVRADILDAIDYSLRHNGGEPNKPFGGKQIIMFGDLFQLPPVIRREETDETLYEQVYSSPYFFNAHALKKAPPEVLELEKVYRQNDPAFIAILDKIRYATAEPGDLEQINRRVEAPDYSGDWSVTLTPTNQHADRINQKRLRELPGKGKTYKGTIDGKWEASALPTFEQLTLKEGSQVMFIRNDTSGKQWVNGTIGKVKTLWANNVHVELENGDICSVEAVTWEKRKYQYDQEAGKIKQEVLGTFTQLPLKLAWAVTIHKSQGLTLDHVNIDLGRGAFAHGQLYVALSRCRTLEGITLSKPVRHRDIIVDPEVVAFLKQNRT